MARLTQFRVSRGRRAVQWAAAAVVLLIGIQFTLWIQAHLNGGRPEISRPPGVESFLPINAMLGLRHFLHTGEIDTIHPAGLAIFLGICLMSAIVARSFCSYLCPVGLLSELLGRLGIRITGRKITLPYWIDIPLRSLKFLLLAFFVWAVWYSMHPAMVAAFIKSPYARVADAKMWLFFADPSSTTIVVISVLLIGSVVIRDLWCRYLCPYGALVGILGLIAPFKVERDPNRCIDCRECSRSCPSLLEVHRMERVTSIECTSCQDCVIACPEPRCLAVRPLIGRAPRTVLRPVTAILIGIFLYLGVIYGFRAAGHWHTSVTEDEYHRRLQKIDLPLYTHTGGMTPREKGTD